MGIVIVDDFYVNEKYRSLDKVTLKENGCLIIDEDIGEVVIGELVNAKNGIGDARCDIVATGKDGADGERGAPGEKGGDGEQGHNGVTVTVTVKKLQGNICLKVSGGNGGNGGKGGCGISDAVTGEARAGQQGGKGGDGGNGAAMTFAYENLVGGTVYFGGAEGGDGGFGGIGGDAAAGAGKGGAPGKKGEPGAKSGDGGDGGEQGKSGTVTIRHSDGSREINGVKQDDPKPYEGVRILNLGNDADYNQYINAFGGEEGMRKFPLVWEAVQNTRDKAKRADTLPLVDKDTQVLLTIDQCDIQPVQTKKASNAADAATSADFYQITASFTSALPNAPKIAANGTPNDNASHDTPQSSPVTLYKESVKVYNKETGVTLLTKFSFGGSEPITQNVYKSELLEKYDVLGQTIVTSITVSYIREDRTVAMAATISKEKRFSADTTSLITKVKVSNPAYKCAGKTAGDVMFLYGRTNSQSSEYVYADYWDTDGPYHKNGYNGGNLGTIVPITGTIYFDSCINAVDISEIDNSSRPKLLYSLTEEGTRNVLCQFRPDITGHDNLAKNLKANKCVTFTPGDLKNFPQAAFDINLSPKTTDKSKYDWEDNIATVFLDNTEHRCYLNAPLMISMTYNGTDVAPPQQICIKSIAPKKLPADEDYFVSKDNCQTVYIPPITIHWGCFARETLIKTADGMLKRADAIIIGDKIAVFGGGIRTVSNVYTGRDSEIYTIKTVDGGYIRVSGGHAMKAYAEDKPRGVRVSAAKLKTGDKLMTRGGTAEVAGVEIEPYNDMVYNFEFEGEFEAETEATYIEANGYWSGGFKAQNEFEAKQAPELTEEAKALFKQHAEFIDYLNDHSTARHTAK